MASTDTRSSLGWRTGTTRLTLREPLALLQSFDPADRARGGHELVAAGLARSADALLDHVDNEFDDRVLSAIAHAVAATPSDPKEPHRVQELRGWAARQFERQALEEAFLGLEPQPVEVLVAPARSSIDAPAAPAPQPAEVPAAPAPRPVEVPTAPAPVLVPPVARPDRRHHISWHPPTDDPAAAPAISCGTPRPSLTWRAS